MSPCPTIRLAFSDHVAQLPRHPLSSPAPTPGGGAAAAMAGRLGALAPDDGRRASPSRGPGLRTETRRAARGPRRRSRRCARGRWPLAGEDSAAYDAVLSAFRLPKETDEEKRARGAAVNRAFQRATDTPLETLRIGRHPRSRSRRSWQTRGVPSAASDVGVAVGLLEAARRGRRDERADEPGEG